MIRAALKEDQNKILSLAGVIGLFESEEIQSVEDLFKGWAQGQLGESPKWIVFQEGEAIIGTAYYAPEQFADGTWNVYFIGVHLDYQRSEVGSKMMRYIEETLAHDDVRVLLVETSSLPNLMKARNFYNKLGYDQEARIREFYKAGEDKIIFRKAIS